mgnify:CR=1 FL=1
MPYTKNYGKIKRAAEQRRARDTVTKFRWKMAITIREIGYVFHDVTHPAGSLRPIIYRFCAEHDIPVNEMVSHRRQSKLVKKRHALMAMLKETTSASLPEIARALNRDHTTVLHGIRKHYERQGAAV